MNNSFKISVLTILMLGQSLVSAADDKNIDSCFSNYKAQNYSLAIEFGKKSIKSSPKDFYSYSCLGRSYFKTGEIDLALSIFKKAEKLATEKAQIAGISSYMGDIYSILRNYEESSKYYNRDLVIRRELNDTEQIAIALSNMGSVYENLNQPDKAISFYEESITLDRNNSSTLCNLALIYESRGDHDIAIKRIKEAINIDERDGDLHKQAIHLLNYGSILTDQKDFATAETVLFNGLNKIRSIGDFIWEGKAFVYFGNLYAVTGQTDKARSHYQQAIKLLSKTNAQSMLADAKAGLKNLK